MSLLESPRCILSNRSGKDILLELAGHRTKLTSCEVGYIFAVVVSAPLPARVPSDRLQPSVTSTALSDPRMDVLDADGWTSESLPQETRSMRCGYVLPCPDALRAESSALPGLGGDFSTKGGTTGEGRQVRPDDWGAAGHRWGNELGSGVHTSLPSHAPNSHAGDVCSGK